MGDKIQGEGDYESARRYDARTKKFVERKQAEGDTLEGDAAAATQALTPEEREALAHAKHGEQDARDAQILREGERKR